MPSLDLEAYLLRALQSPVGLELVNCKPTPEYFRNKLYDARKNLLDRYPDLAVLSFVILADGRLWIVRRDANAPQS